MLSFPYETTCRAFSEEKSGDQVSNTRSESKRIMGKKITCPDCKGTDKVEVTEYCGRCNGSGEVELIDDWGMKKKVPCLPCRGTGKIKDEDDCPMCGGAGEIEV
jgi:RecJ-like exonuclease